MSSVETSLSSQGPRFAPEDPTLPKPWKGLVDGTTGFLYYWNPETNVTQYERPAGEAPPLPLGPPPAATTPKLAPLPVARSMSANGIMTQQPGQQALLQPGQQMLQPQPSHQQLLQQPGQQLPQHAQKMPYQQIQIQNQQVQQASQQQTQQYQNMQQQQMPYAQVSYLQGQLMPHPQGAQQGMQISQQQGQDPLVTQLPQQHGQQSQISQIMLQQEQQSHGLLTTHQHAQQLHLQGQQQPDQQGHHPPGQQFTHQHSQQIGFMRAEETGSHDVKQGGYPSPLAQVGVISSNHHPPGIVPQVQIPRVGVHTFQPPQQHGGLPSVNAQSTSATSVNLQSDGMDTMQRQQRLGSSMIINQSGHGSGTIHPPIGMKLSYEEDRQGKVGSDFYSGRNDGSMLQHQTKLAVLPLAQKQQDTRMGAHNSSFAAHGPPAGLNMLPTRAMSDLYNHPPFPNASPMRPSPRVPGPSDISSISSVEAYRQHHEVTAMGDNVPDPFMTFETTGFPPEILKEMHFAGFSSPTPIQAQSWPIALQSRDIVAIAKTGSGKTLGYLIPAFMHLRRCRNNPQDGPTVLVLAPTRELATQIQDEAIKFGRSLRVSCTCLYGGSPKGPQLREIERGADIIVATPGRLNDILEMKKISFHQVSFLVLDEADRMLDMGFEPQIRKIVDQIPPRRQTLMYTATWPKDVRKIAADLMVNPVQVNIGRVNELVANKSITQYVEVVPPMERQRRLEEILRSQERGSKTIIFCSTKRLCDQLTHSIGRTFGAAAIHGDKSQDQRDRVLGHFRSGRSPILVATDVAARGLDIKDIRVVINYDFPTGIEDYIHRIGRTGRAGAMGVAYTFISDQDWKYAPDLIKVLEGANQFVPPAIREMAERGGAVNTRGRGEMSRWESGGGSRWDSGAGRGMRDGGGRRDLGAGRGMRDGGGRWDSGAGRGMRDGAVTVGFGNRGGGSNFGGRGGSRNDFGGRGGRGRGFGGPGVPGGWGRQDRGQNSDRHTSSDGRNYYDNRRGIADRNRDRKYSPSPERVRTYGYDRSRSPSRSRSRSRSFSRSRSRSWSGSRSRSHSRSRSRSNGRFDRPRRRPSMFDVPLMAPPGQEAPAPSGLNAPAPAPAPAPAYEPPAVSGFDASQMSPMSPGQDRVSFPSNQTAVHLPVPPESVNASFPEASADPPELHPLGNL